MTPLSVTIPGFKEVFGSSEACKDFLMDHKWKTQGRCIKCGAQDFRKASTHYHRRCIACDYEESILKNTVFEGIKFPLDKAFYMCYRVRDKAGSISSLKLMMETLVSVPTAIKFKNKIIQTLDAEKIPLRPEGMNIDNFLVGLI